jgi:hypothetical protein
VNDSQFFGGEQHSAAVHKSHGVVPSNGDPLPQSIVLVNNAHVFGTQQSSFVQVAPVHGPGFCLLVYPEPQLNKGDTGHVGAGVQQSVSMHVCPVHTGNIALTLQFCGHG